MAAEERSEAGEQPERAWQCGRCGHEPATRQAEEILAEARRRAEGIVATAEAKAELELVELTARRDALNEQLERVKERLGPLMAAAERAAERAEFLPPPARRGLWHRLRGG